MKKISLKSLDNDIVFGSIHGLTQEWDDMEHTYSFLGNPRTEHGFMYVNCDTVKVVYKNKDEETFLRGDFLYIPKYSEYRIEFPQSNGGEYFDILVNFDMRNTSGEEFRLADKVTCLTRDVPRKIINYMRDIEHVSTNLVHPCIRTSKIFFELLDKIVNRISMPEMLDEEKNPVYPAVYYLDNHVRDDISVPDLAKMCLLSESAFRKAFKAHTGMTPIQYRTHIKICKAQELLRSTTEISVREIGETLGFFDNVYFHKTFTKFTGMTPKQYRKQYVNKAKPV